MTHTSYARETEQSSEEGVSVADNEQLEFLGDAVLELVTSEKLFQSFPQFREGELSKFRAFLVSEQHLIHAAKKLTHRPLPASWDEAKKKAVDARRWRSRSTL